MDDAGAIYEAKYQPDKKLRNAALLQFIPATVISLLLVMEPDMPLWAGLGMLGLSVGFLTILYVPLALARRSQLTAFRIDRAGVTLGGRPPRYKASTAFIPWHEVAEIRICTMRGRRYQSPPWIGVIRRAGAPELPGGFDHGWLSRRIAGRGVAARRLIRMWTLDQNRLRTVMSAVAPGVPVGIVPPSKDGYSEFRHWETN